LLGDEVIELVLVLGEGPDPGGEGVGALSSTEGMDLAECVTDRSLGIADELGFVEDVLCPQGAGGEGILEPLSCVDLVLAGVVPTEGCIGGDVEGDAIGPEPLDRSWGDVGKPDDDGLRGGRGEFGRVGWERCSAHG
jgi:hypothetical protein